MPILSRDQILSARPKTIEVEVPAMGGSVRIKALSINDRLALLDEYKANIAAVEEFEADQQLTPKARKKLPKVELHDQAILQLIHSLVDENDQRIFTVADHDLIKDLDYNVVQNLLKLYLELNNSETSVKKNSD